MKGEQMMLYKTVAASSTGVAEWISWGSKPVSGLMDSLAVLMVLPASASSKYAVDVSEKKSSRSGKAAPSSSSGFAGSSFMRMVALVLMATSVVGRELDFCNTDYNRVEFPWGNSDVVLTKLDSLTAVNQLFQDQEGLYGVNTSLVTLTVGGNGLTNRAEAIAAGPSVCGPDQSEAQYALKMANTMYTFFADASGNYTSDFDTALSQGDLAAMETAIANGSGITLHFQPTSSPTPEPIASPTGSPSSQPSASPSASPIASPTGSPSSQPSGSPSGSPSASPTVAVTFHPSASPTDGPIIEITISPSAAPTPGGTTESSGGVSCLLTATQMHELGCSENPGLFGALLYEYERNGCITSLGIATNDCDIVAKPATMAHLSGSRVLDLTNFDINNVLHTTVLGGTGETVKEKLDPVVKDVKTNGTWITWAGTGVALGTMIATIGTILGVAAVADNRRQVGLATDALSRVPGVDKGYIEVYAGDPAQDFVRPTNESPHQVLREFAPDVSSDGFTERDLRQFHSQIEKMAKSLRARLKGCLSTGGRPDNAARTVVLSLLAKIQSLKPGDREAQKNFSDTVPRADGTYSGETTLDILSNAVDRVVGTDLNPAFGYLQGRLVAAAQDLEEGGAVYPLEIAEVYINPE